MFVAATFMEFFTDLFSDVRTLAGSALAALGIIAALVISTRGRFSIGSIIMAIVIGGLITAAGVALLVVANLAQEELKERQGSPANPLIVHDQTVTAARGDIDALPRIAQV